MKYSKNLNKQKEFLNYLNKQYTTDKYRELDYKYMDLLGILYGRSIFLNGCYLKFEIDKVVIEVPFNIDFSRSNISINTLEKWITQLEKFKEL